MSARLKSFQRDNQYRGETPKKRPFADHLFLPRFLIEPHIVADQLFWRNKQVETVCQRGGTSINRQINDEELFGFLGMDDRGIAYFGDADAVKEFHDFGIFGGIHRGQHLVAGERECVGGGARFPADIDFDGAHNGGVKTVDDEPEKLAHVILGVTRENLYAFFGGDFLDRADKPERPDDAIAGPHELDQGFPFVEYANIQRGADHFTLDRGFVKNGVEFVSM